MNLLSKSQAITNDSLVCLPKIVAQNILKSRDSTEALKTAYKNLSDNYQRLKTKSSIQDSAYSYKDKETKVCRELYQAQAKEIELWGIKSHNQSKEVRKQKFFKWVAIILGSAALGWAAIK